MCNDDYLVGSIVNLPDGDRGVVVGGFPDPFNPEAPYLIVQPSGGCGERVTLPASEVS